VSADKLHLGLRGELSCLMLPWRPVVRLSVRYIEQGHWAAWRVIDSFFLRLTIYRGGGRTLSFPA